ncbi:MAG: FAD-binding oxidoreductase [candidate division Zixibacteria bacterium]|nr:FAD-binding oxidoreductase [candidate division Zixibacteria bacterium]
MLTDKNIEDIKNILGESRFKVEQGKAYAEPGETSVIPELVRLALREKFRIFPSGNGTKTNLLRFPEEKTLFLKLSSLCQVKKVVPEDLYVVVEPGLELKELNSELAKYNLFYPLSMDDSEGTIGGSVASGLSAIVGTKEVSTKELVLALELVNSSGKVLKSGSEVFKSVTGYDTTRLLVGSWGTLGIIISVSLRVFPLNRRKEFTDLKIAPAVPLKLKDKDKARVVLHRRIKKLLDPEGVFVELF